jgi:transposase
MYDSTTTVAGGLLQASHVPSPELKAARDLVRAREDARLDRMRDRHRLSKFCLRHGRRLPTSSWTVVRRKWLSEQRFEFAAQQQTFDTYLHAVDLVDARIEALERAIRETAEREPLRALVARLRCLRGIDTLTALALVAEIDDFNRFTTAEEFMAFVGLVPSERSSGERRRQGSITKVGNSHVRRLLVESAWHARRRPKVGYGLARRQRGQDAVVVERAWRCQQRLYQRWQRMAGHGKPTAKDRRRLRPRARSASSGRSPPSNHSAAADPQPASRPRAADAPDHTENPRQLYAAPLSGDPRP